MLRRLRPRLFPNPRLRLSPLRLFLSQWLHRRRRLPRLSWLRSQWTYWN